MITKLLLLSILITINCFGQDCSERDNQIKKLKTENETLKIENDKLKTISISFYKSVNFLKSPTVFGNYINEITESIDDFEEKNEFVISFNAPNDPRPIIFSEIKDCDGIHFNNDKSAIDFEVKDGCRHFVFPKKDDVDILSDSIKNRIVNAFKHIKDLMCKNNVIIESNKQGKIFD